jgi:hypothetical protein
MTYTQQIIFIYVVAAVLVALLGSVLWTTSWSLISP